MFKRFLNSQTKTITFAAILLGASALISRVLGLVRDGLIAGYFGRSVEADIYFTAFRIPDLVYNLLIIGGLSVVFLPLFSEYFAKDKNKAWEMVNYILNIFLFLLILVSAVLFLLAPWLMKLVAPGFSDEAQSSAVLLTRLMFLSPILFGLSSVFSGILHYFNRFLVYGLAPVFYNLGIIFGILALSPKYGIFGVGIGVVLGAFLHCLIQIPAAVSCGFRYRALFSFKYPAVRKTFYLMLPRSLAVGAQQINLIVINAIASTLMVGSIAVFNLANNLQYFPIGLIGIPFALAVFPALSKSWASGQKESFFETFSSTFRQILFLVVPAGILLFILRAQFVRLVFGTLGPGNFDWSATKLTAACLGLFSVGIFASALIPFLSRSFFALQDTKTPTFISVLTVILNIVLSFSFVWLLGFSNAFHSFLSGILKLKSMENIAVIGLPLAFSLAVIFQVILLLIFFYKKIGDFKIKEIWISFQKTILASLFSGVAAYSVLIFADSFINTHIVLGLLTQTALAGFAGALTYIFIAFLLRSPELKIIKLSILEQFKK